MIPIFNPQRIAFSMNKRRFNTLQNKSLNRIVRELNTSLPVYDETVKLNPDIEYSLLLPWMGSERYYPKSPQLISEQTGQSIQEFSVKLYRINLFKNETEAFTKSERDMWLSFGEGYIPHNDSNTVHYNILTLAQPTFDQKLLRLIMTALEILEKKASVVAPRFTLNNINYQLYLDGEPRR